MIEITRQNLKRSGMEGHVKTFVKDALTVGKGGMKGSIICNPPYGERLLNPFQARKLYADMGQAFSKLNGWQIYILTAADGFERAYGKKADKIRKLYNGMLKCNLYQYYKPEKKE
jgi:putative N6-adenine-specific DNA methylase